MSLFKCEYWHWVCANGRKTTCSSFYWWCVKLFFNKIIDLAKNFNRFLQLFHSTYFFTIFLLSWSPPWTLKHLTATYPKAPCIDNRTTELAPDPSSPSLPTMQNMSSLSSSFNWSIWARLHEKEIQNFLLFHTWRWSPFLLKMSGVAFVWVFSRKCLQIFEVKKLCIIF